MTLAACFGCKFKCKWTTTLGYIWLGIDLGSPVRNHAGDKFPFIDSLRDAIYRVVRAFQGVWRAGLFTMRWQSQQHRSSLSPFFYFPVAPIKLYWTLFLLHPFLALLPFLNLSSHRIFSLHLPPQPPITPFLFNFPISCYSLVLTHYPHRT